MVSSWLKKNQTPILTMKCRNIGSNPSRRNALETLFLFHAKALISTHLLVIQKQSLISHLLLIFYLFFGPSEANRDVAECKLAERWAVRQVKRPAIKRDKLRGGILSERKGTARRSAERSSAWGVKSLFRPVPKSCIMSKYPHSARKLLFSSAAGGRRTRPRTRLPARGRKNPNGTQNLMIHLT